MFSPTTGISSRKAFGRFFGFTKPSRRQTFKLLARLLN